MFSDKTFSHHLTQRTGITLQPVISGERYSAQRQMKQAKRDAGSEHGFVVDREARCEVDTRADTCCAGMNFRPVEYTGMTCDVSPFHDQYEAMKGVPVATCATAYDFPDGTTAILIFHESLYFGQSMDHSLINPNQIRLNGIMLSDDAFDMDRKFGIHHPNGHIDFETAGTCVYFNTRVPSDAEMADCPHLVMTDIREWVPSAVHLSSHRPKEEERFVMAARNSRDMKLEVSESDDHLGSISDFYVEKRLTERIISNVQISNLRRTEEVVTDTRHSKATPEHLSKIWNIGLETAKRTLKVTTQRGIRTAIHPLHRRYRVDHLNLNQRRLRDQFYMDHLTSKTKSLNGNVGAWVITNGSFTEVYPVDHRNKVAEALTDFAQDVGIPTDLRCDLAPEVTGRHTKFQEEVRRLKVRMTYSETGRSNQNHKAELEIRELKRRWRRKMIDKQVPKRLWDYGLRHAAAIMKLIPRGSNGRTGYEEVTGITPDIAEWIDFDFYDRVWYWDKKHPGITEEERKLARWLGVSHRVGSDMCYWLLTPSGQVIARTPVQHVVRTEMLDPDLKKLIDEFDAKVKERLNDANFQNPDGTDLYMEDEDSAEEQAYGDGSKTPSDAEYGDMLQEERPEADDIDSDAYDKFIGAEVNIDVAGEGPLRATVKRRATDYDGNFLGQAHRNPLLDTREYELEFEDGTTDKYLANTIAENIYTQVDTEGQRHAAIREIVDHKSDDSAITIQNGFTVGRSGNRVPKKTTRGWKLLIELTDGSTEWVALKDLKESNPVELAEYAIGNGIANEPAFNWWVSYVIRKRERIISKLKSKYWRTTHKYGIRIPKDVKEAMQLDEANGNTFWQDAIRKEMEKVCVAYSVNEDFTPDEVRKGKAPGLIGFQEITCHIIFDVKMDFTRKARLVAGGHTTVTPSSITYSSVVSRDSVRLAFMLAALNDLDILACDVGNAYLNAPCREKIWFTAGLECGQHAGKVMVVTRALYGLKSSGAAWRAMFAETLKEMGFVPTMADPDVWRRKNVKPNGQYYYELMLVYVDDCLAVSHDPQNIMDVLSKSYELKKGSVKAPEIYLGAEISKYQLKNGRLVWSMSSSQYVKNAVKNVNDMLKEEGRELKTGKKQGKTPLPSNYKPELDTTAELNGEMGSRYLQLIGILRWSIELGRIDVLTETSIMSQYAANPRKGHLEAVYHIFLYLSKHEKSRLAFDPSRPKVDESVFNADADWKDFYGDVEEELPTKMPEPLGKSVKISCFVDADHAGNVVTRRSRTGIIIFVQNTPIIWYSKKQNTVESSTFGSELVAMRIAKDMLVALRYKLRMFGVPIDGPADVYCDNQGVVLNVSKPESTLNKKHNAINYHAVREAVAAQILRVGKEDTEWNLADLMTKVLTVDRRKQLLGSILYSM